LVCFGKINFNAAVFQSIPCLVNNKTGDAEGTPRGTNIEKNIPTFKIEHWDKPALKLFRIGICQFCRLAFNPPGSPEQNRTLLNINELEYGGRNKYGL
jgi:hypothetical protein